jgi:hypothetical protein
MILTPASESESFRVLLALAERRTGRIPPDRLVRHVLSVTAEAGWPVQRAALEAVLRRLAFAKQDGLTVAAAPAAGRGVFTTRRRGSAARPYKVLLDQVEPLRAACDCRDFIRNSLGLCKHALTVLSEHPSILTGRGGRGVGRRPPRVPRLIWEPVRPLAGLGDWMERVRLVGPGAAVARSEIPVQHFRRQREGTYVLDAPRPDDAIRRREVVEALLQAAGRKALAIEPPLLALLRREKELRDPVVRGRPSPAVVAEALRSLKLRLYPYQREGVRRFLAVGRLVLADDMGLGKTAQAIAAAHVLFRTGAARRGLLIVPASLKDQWLREWRLFTDAPLSVVEGNPRSRAAVYRSTPTGFLVTNYEQVLRALETGSGGARRGPADQELGNEDGGLREGVDPGLPAGADRHADGEPPRGAGFHPRLGR